MQRRQFMGLAAMGTASLWLPGCAGDDPQPSTPDPVVAPPARASEVFTVGDRPSTFAADGTSFEINADAHVIAVRSAEGANLGLIGTMDRFPTDALGTLDGPRRAEWDETGQRLLVLELGNRRIQTFDRSGRSLGVIAKLTMPNDMVVAKDRTIYVAETVAHRISVLSPEGNLLRTIGSFGLDRSRLNGPIALTLDARGQLHVIDAGSAQVKVFSASGSYVTSYGAGLFIAPRSIAVDSQDRIWVADRLANSVAVFDSSGRLVDRIASRTANGGAGSPTSVTRRVDGSIFISVVATG